MARRQQALRTVCLGLAGAVLSATAVVAVRPDRGAPAPAPSLSADALQVALDGPRVALRGQETSFVVSASGARPLASIELWVGAALADRADLPPGTLLMRRTLRWRAGTAGRVIAVARVTDSEGQIATSLASALDVGGPAFSATPVVAEPGETLVGVATRAGADRSNIEALNPHLLADDPLTGGTQVLVPVSVPAPDDVPPGDGTGDAGPTLDLDTSGDGCTATLSVGDLTPPGERPQIWSLEVVRTSAGGAPSVVGGVEATGTSAEIVDSPGPGEHIYEAVEHSVVDRASPFVALSVPSTCGPGDEPALDAGVVHVDGSIDGVFVYLAYGGLVVRVPDDPTLLIEGDGGTFDLRPHLPPLLSGTVSVELWGRAGGIVRLLDTFEVDAGDLPSTATMVSARVQVGPIFIASPYIDAATDGTVPFEWSSAVEHARIRWYATVLAPGPTSGIAPTGVVQSGEADATNRHGTFSVDMTKNATPRYRISILPGGVVDPETPDDSGSVRALDPGALRLLGHSTVYVWAVPLDGNGDPIGPPSSTAQVFLSPPPYDPSDAPPFDAQVSGKIPPVPNHNLGKCVRILDERPRAHRGLGWPSPGNPFLPYTYDADQDAIYPFTVCASDYQQGGGGGSDCGDWSIDGVMDCASEVGEAIGSALSGLADLAGAGIELLNDLKAAVVDAVAGALCPDAVSGPCHTLVEIGINLLLSSALGVPPTLPDFDDLANLAKGQLVDLALDQLGVGDACDAVAAAAGGGGCGQLLEALSDQDLCALASDEDRQGCRELVDEAAGLCELATGAEECRLATNNARDLVLAGARPLIDQAYDQMVVASRREVRDAIAASSGLPLTFTDIDVIPEPLALRQPFRVHVSLARNSNPLPGDYACGGLTARVITWTTLGGSGEPYLSASVPFPPLADGGQSGTVTLVLDEPNLTFELSDQHRPPPPPSQVSHSGDIGTVQQGLQGIGAGADWRYLLDEGSLVFAEISGDCIPKTFRYLGKIPGPQARPAPGTAP